MRSGATLPMLLVLSVLSIREAWGFDLAAALSAARQSDSQWLAAQAKYQEAVEKIPQARAQLLPNLELDADAMHNQQQIEFPDSGAPTQSGNFGTHEATLNLKVPLWHQPSWANMTQAQQAVAQARWELTAAEMDLVRRLVQAYAEVLDAQQALKLNEALKTAYSSQLNQAQARFEHGEASIVDADQARAQYDQAAADVIDGRNTLAIKQAALAEIIGPLSGDPAPLSADYQPSPLTPASLEEWQRLAEHGNEDYLSKAKAVEVAETELKKQHEAYLPSLDLVGVYARNGTGNPQLTGQTGSVTQQSQIGVKMSLPIYSGGATASAVRAAAAALKQAKDAQEQSRRQLDTRVTESYLSVFNGATMIKARQQAMTSARTSLQSAIKGLQHDKKTQLDVLAAQQQMTSAEKNLSKAQMDVWASEITLDSLAGRIDQQSLERFNAVLADEGNPQGQAAPLPN